MQSVRKLTKPSQRQFPKQLWTHFVLLLTFPQKKGDASLAENLSASLAEISADLDSASGTVQAFSDMTDAASLMLDTTSVIFPIPETDKDKPWRLDRCRKRDCFSFFRFIRHN